MSMEWLADFSVDTLGFFPEVIFPWQYRSRTLFLLFFEIWFLVCSLTLHWKYETFNPLTTNAPII